MHIAASLIDLKPGKYYLPQQQNLIPASVSSLTIN
jgi:hypothetical protein